MKKIFFDAHQDVLMHEQDRNKGIVQTGFDALVKSRVKLVVVAVFLEPEDTAGLTDQGKATLARKQIAEYLDIIRQNKKLMLVTGYEDLQALMHSDLTGILLHIEGVDFISENNLDLIDEFYALGLRSVGLVWGQDNYIGGYSGSCQGLSDFGKKFIAKLDEKNIIIDLSHANEKTFYATLNATKRPVMVSHGNSYELCPNPRNFKAEQLAWLAERGGVQGVFFSKKYVSSNPAAEVEEVIAHFAKSYSISPNLTMLGTDFGGISSGFVGDLKSIDQLPKLVELIEKKLGREAAERISYKNFLIFLEKIYGNR